MKEISNFIKKTFSKNRLIIVTNREPYIIKKTVSGIAKERAAGGLISALEPIMRACNGQWIAWHEADKQDSKDLDTNKMKEIRREAGYVLHAVSLTDKEISNYYYGLSNRALWPLAHNLLGYCKFNADQWRDYVKVNNKFSQVILEKSKPSDLIWIHDYQLSLVPNLMRQNKKNLQIAFFWHIPIPSVETFSVFPWRREILLGLLGSNFIGFHTKTYVKNFLDCVKNLLSAEVDYTKGEINFDGRSIKVSEHPIGIDFSGFEEIAKDEKVIERSNQLRKIIGGEILCLGVDRLDYTKGILERLLAIERFFEKYPKYRKKVVFVQIAVPSRTKVEEYRKMKQEIDEAIGRIDGKFTEEGWIPIRYLYRSLPLTELIAYYRAADIALITPLKDGMNLVAKEYIATRYNNNGVLILSEHAGAADEFKESLTVNPYNIEEVADTIKDAIELDEKEKKKKMIILRKKTKDRDVFWWLEDYWKSAQKNFEIENEIKLAGVKKSITPLLSDKQLSSHFPISK